MNSSITMKVDSFYLCTKMLEEINFNNLTLHPSPTLYDHEQFAEGEISFYLRPFEAQSLQRYQSTGSGHFYLTLVYPEDQFNFNCYELLVQTIPISEDEDNDWRYCTFKFYANAWEFDNFYNGWVNRLALMKAYENITAKRLEAKQAEKDFLHLAGWFMEYENLELWEKEVDGKVLVVPPQTALRIEEAMSRMKGKLS